MNHLDWLLRPPVQCFLSVRHYVAACYPDQSSYFLRRHRPIASLQSLSGEVPLNCLHPRRRGAWYWLLRGWLASCRCRLPRISLLHQRSFAIITGPRNRWHFPGRVVKQLFPPSFYLGRFSLERRGQADWLMVSWSRGFCRLFYRLGCQSRGSFCLRYCLDGNASYLHPLTSDLDRHNFEPCMRYRSIHFQFYC